MRKIGFILAAIALSSSAVSAAPPVLGVSPTYMEFTAYEGGANPEPNILSIWRDGGNGPLNWDVIEECNWITVEPNSGKSMGEVDDCNVIVDITGLTDGLYNCQLTVDAGTAANSPQIVDVNLVIQPWAGSGMPNDPYQIWDANDMQAIGADANYWDAHFRLMVDIDLGGFTGTAFNIIGEYIGYGDPNNKPFTGVFDGNNHTILNLSYTTTQASYVGLFGYIDGNNAEIRDLGLIDPNIRIDSGDYMGSIVALLLDGSVTGCYVEGGSVSGSWYVGGLVGLSSGEISNSYSNVRVSGFIRVGGLVGHNLGTISSCYSFGTVSGDHFVGGLVGINHTSISDSYSTGGISGDSWIGGLVGTNGGEVIYCYSTGSVSGTQNVGGLVAYDNDGLYISCFWDVETSGEPNSAGGTGKTTAEMQTASTFVGWGCDGAWTIDDGNDYPRLVWENKPGEHIINASYWAGSGTKDDPYLIYTAEELNIIGLIVCDLDKHFNLMVDIDLGGYSENRFNMIGTPWNNPFTGVFDGDGHTIFNFMYTSVWSAEHIGLFKFLDDPNAQIKDLGLIEPNVDVEMGTHVGSLIGTVYDGTIIDCYSEKGSILGEVGVGGLVGHNYGGTISNCYSTGSVSGIQNVGGLVGMDLEGTVVNCYSTGIAQGDEWVGGLVGEAYTGNISNCYSSASVSGDWCGGLVGRDNSSFYTQCFWDSNVNPGVNGIGNGSDPNVIGESTANMQTESTFTDAGWDFVGEVINGPNDFWDICEGMNYPKLSWQIPVGDFICPDGVTFVDFSVLGAAWLSEPGQPNWDPNCDISEPNDNVIDESDVMVFTNNWLAGL